MATPYIKIYTRENSLVSYGVWCDEVKHAKERMGLDRHDILLDVREGVAEAYIEEQMFPDTEKYFREQIKIDPDFVPKWLKRHEEDLRPLEAAWKAGKPLASREALLTFCDQMKDAWVSLEVTYFVPSVPAGDVPEDQRAAALALRTRAQMFLDDSDRVVVQTLRFLYPALGEHVRYITLAELRAGTVPDVATLAARETHCILFGFESQALLGVTLAGMCARHGIELEKVVIPSGNTLSGQVAMAGKATGRARVLHKKSEVSTLLEGEILVTAMTTPDYLPAMKKAAAFVTDEGGVTCHAAIVAREFGKPCVIGTKFATQKIKTGDLLEIDAEKGVVTIHPST